MISAPSVPVRRTGTLVLPKEEPVSTDPKPECAYDVRAEAVEFDDRPIFTCLAPPVYRVEGDREREDSYACAQHIAWLKAELAWVPELHVEALVAMAGITVITAEGVSSGDLLTDDSIRVNPPTEE